MKKNCHKRPLRLVKYFLVCQGIAVFVCGLFFHSITAQANQQNETESSLSREERIRAFVLDDTPEEAHNQMPEKLAAVGVSEHLGRTIDTSLEFKDHTGNVVKLGDFFGSNKPVLLSLNYYDCETLCTLQHTGIANALAELDWLPGREFDMVTVSIDPTNGPLLARNKRASYLDYVGREGAQWSFLISEEDTVKSLAAQLGFQYSYDEDTDQYAHPAVTYLLTPEGKISRYLYGIDPSSRDLKFALMDASEGRLGTTLERFILSCFHYDDLRGQYTPFALSTMRVGGLITMSIVGVWIGALWKREKRKRLREKTS